jgi:hypothetical protein
MKNKNSKMDKNRKKIIRALNNMKYIKMEWKEVKKLFEIKDEKNNNN